MIRIDKLISQREQSSYKTNFPLKIYQQNFRGLECKALRSMGREMQVTIERLNTRKCRQNLINRTYGNTARFHIMRK